MCNYDKCTIKRAVMYVHRKRRVCDMTWRASTTAVLIVTQIFKTATKLISIVYKNQNFLWNSIGRIIVWCR